MILCECIGEDTSKMPVSVKETRGHVCSHCLMQLATVRLYGFNGLDQLAANRPYRRHFGGQQQRVAIARALATKPALILADEPTGNLDSKTSMDVILLMQSISRQFHQTTVMITHNEEIAQIRGGNRFVSYP